MILSAYSSDLRKKLDTWDDLDGGWTQLILCMMWETSRGIDSPWSWYLSSMPTDFNTPMFWSREEIKGLQGTSIENRIGRREAEELYHDTIEPLVKVCTA
jgi:SET domain-containing protein 6